MPSFESNLSACTDSLEDSKPLLTLSMMPLAYIHSCSSSFHDAVSLHVYMTLMELNALQLEMILCKKTARVDLYFEWVFVGPLKCHFALEEAVVRNKADEDSSWEVEVLECTERLIVLVFLQGKDIEGVLAVVVLK